MLVSEKVVERGMVVWHIVFAAGVLLLLSRGDITLFRWLLAMGFGLDLGSRFLLNRLYRRSQRKTARPENAGDDVVLVAGVVGTLVFRTDFFIQQCYFILLIDVLFLGKTFLSLVKFRRIVDFHTYTGRVAGFSQIVFLLLLFFLPEPLRVVFYITVVLTLVSLVEQLILLSQTETRHDPYLPATPSTRIT